MRGRFSPGVLALALAMAGCGGGRASQTHTVRIDVGGFVVYQYDFGVPMAGVTVTLTDALGETRTATTNSAGAWTIEDIGPGVYAEAFSAPGYETRTGTWTIPLQGDNDVSNVFLGHDLTLLVEELLRIELSPFEETLVQDETLTDGQGATLVYSTSGDAAITLTTSRPLALGIPSLTDGVTLTSIQATPDLSRTVWTFSESAIMSMNASVTPADPGIRHDQDPDTRHQIIVEVLTYSPIHGTSLTSYSVAEFNATP